VNVQLGHDIFSMRVYSADRNAELVGNFLVGHPLCNQLQDFPFLLAYLEIVCCSSPDTPTQSAAINPQCLAHSFSCHIFIINLTDGISDILFMKKLIPLLMIQLFIFTLVRANTPTSTVEHRKLLPERLLLPDSMTFQEYVIQNRELTWKRLAVAAMVPGYIHFYAGAPRAGWILATTRILGTAITMYGIVDQLNNMEELSGNFWNYGNTLAHSKTNIQLILGGTLLNFTGFAIDWAHGDYIIERERLRIEYKFRLRVEQSSWKRSAAHSTWITLQASL